ncbi:MAG: hypothetical protein R3348_01265, partial [Xanthomonadales bacterium]|nr:hypothetical protein [Xanthomonadales bacterium]
REAGQATEPQQSVPHESIAVLPFVNMSADPDQEYFSDGISEELLNLLAAVPDLKVISRTSAFFYKNKEVKLSQVAEELNVAHILEGSVRKAGNQVRVTAQLIEAKSDTHLWSETYDRTLDDIFAIQDEIAAAVVEQLKITLLGDVPQTREVDPEAYSLYLQARHLGSLGSADGYEQSIELFKQALDVEPQYAAAWEGLSRNYVNQAAVGLADSDEAYSAARDAAQRALEIDPDYALAHGRLGWIAVQHDNDLSAGARHFERGLALEPENIDLIRNAIVPLISLNRKAENVALNEFVVTRDPLNTVVHTNMGFVYYLDSQWDKAINSYRTALRLSPDAITTNAFIGFSLLRKGEPKAALTQIVDEKFELLRLLGLMMAYHDLGDPQASDQALAELNEKFADNWSYYIAGGLAYRGESDRAFEMLEQALAQGSQGLSYIPSDPMFDNLRTDPRWTPLLEKMGKSPAQLQAIEFKVTLPGG